MKNEGVFTTLKNEGVFTALLVVTMLFFLGCWVGRCTAISSFENEAVEEGFARYNEGTGDWEWKESKTEEKIQQQP